MSNPYERLIEPPRQPAPAPPRQEQSFVKKLAAAPKQRRIEKPFVRFNVRPRFRFDLPDPPMDPKMLLGTLSSASYANPYVSEMERDSHPAAVPSDVTYGLHANWVDTSMYKVPAVLSMGDDMLLDSIMQNRPKGNLLKPSSGNRHASRRGKNPLSSRQPDSSSAPWMRRMAYDEYETNAGRLSMRRNESFGKLKRDVNVNETELIERKRRAMRQSFKPVKGKWKHPDRRKQHLRPVKITPVHPDFRGLVQEIIAMEFDKDDQLTLAERIRKDPEAAQESIGSTATISVAERHRKHGEQEKKFIACYTPTSRTLTKRKRKKEAAEENGANETGKKIHFLDDEKYEWNGEYSIRERKYADVGPNAKPARSCVKLVFHNAPGGKSSIATCTRVGTIWKLARRAQVGDDRLGKDGLNIAREEGTNGFEDETLRNILANRVGVNE